MTNHPLMTRSIHPSWQHCFSEAISQVDSKYLQKLESTNDWLPGFDKIFNAFSLPLTKVNYVLFGETPYPRKISANGYAFWDANINDLWSSTGLSTAVNRATSFRNIIKMLLVAEKVLDPKHPTQENIVKINKQAFVSTNQELFTNLLNHGFLLLNASLVLSANSKMNDAKAWLPFLRVLLNCVLNERPAIKLIIFGKIANVIHTQVKWGSNVLCAEHPYNHSFINNSDVRSFFEPLHLLHRQRI